MSVERTFTCENCPRHVKTHGPLPPTFLTVIQDSNLRHESVVTRHFCGWDCLLHHAAKETPAEWFDADGNPIDRPTGEDPWPGKETPDAE